MVLSSVPEDHLVHNIDRNRNEKSDGYYKKLSPDLVPFLSILSIISDFASSSAHVVYEARNRVWAALWVSRYYTVSGRNGKFR
jgi:hypothetical protein